MRERRTVFGEVPDLYDKARAPYPEAVVDDVLAYARGRTSVPLRALEVGAGTGKATVAFAARDVDILALEPDEAMAAVARRNCAPCRHVAFEVSTFEDWQPDRDHRFDLVFSAQAWHWVAPGVRVVKAAEVLRPRGSVALFWHRTDWRGEPLRDELDALYRRVAPDLHAQNPGFPGLVPADTVPGVAELTDSGLFDGLVTRTYPWSATFGAQSFVELALTQSNHRLLDEEVRERLFRAVGRLIDARGGEVTIPHATFLVLARLR